MIATSNIAKMVLLTVMLATGSLALHAQLNYDYTAGKFLIKGNVVDLGTQAPLGLANIRVLNSRRGLTCDNDGSFTMYVSKTDSLEFSAMGFVTKLVSVASFDSSRYYTLKIELLHDFIKLKEVTIYPFRDVDEFKTAFMGAKQSRFVIPGIAPAKYSNNVVKPKFTNPVSYLYDRLKSEVLLILILSHNSSKNIFGMQSEDDFELPLETGPYTQKSQSAQADGDYILAEQLMLEAVANQEEDSLFSMGHFYHHAVQQYKKAASYYLKAVDKGDLRAMFNLATLYEDVADMQNYDAAETYYLKAGLLGLPHAMYNLAMLYANVKNDYDKAKTWYLKCIELNDVNAMCNLALLYMQETDYDKAEFYYKKAISLGDAEAMYGLAFLFDTMKKDYAQAETWYIKAIEHGNFEALSYLPSFYKLTKLEPDKGIKFCQKAHAMEPDVPQILWMLTYLQVLKRDWPEARKTAENFLSMEAAYWSSDLVMEILDKFLAAKEYSFLLKQFENEVHPLNKFARHYYYVLAWFYKDKLPGQYETAGAAMKQLADEIIERILSAELQPPLD